MLKLINKILETPPLKREALRIIVCCIFIIPLNILLITGVDGGGEIKSWAEKPIKTLTSANLLKFMLYYFLPLLAYTIIKAIILNANKKYEGFLSFLANQLTGALYCAALVSISLAYKLYLLDDHSYKSLMSYSPIFISSGFMYFYISQCAIQRSMTPKLL